jgi:hypothetical protein
MSASGLADDSQASQAASDLPRDVETSGPENQDKENERKTIQVQEDKKEKNEDQ